MAPPLTSRSGLAAPFFVEEAVADAEPAVIELLTAASKEAPSEGRAMFPLTSQKPLVYGGQGGAVSDGL